MSEATGIRVVPSGTGLAASVEGLDLSRPLDDAQWQTVIDAIAAHGVLRFPAQQLTSQQLFEFSSRFGTPEINVGGMFQEPGLPQVMILSNIQRDGKPVGIGDAGQDWHTDMSYSGTVAFANVLYALEVPHRDGRPLGETRFSDMAAAYDTLPDDVKAKIEGRTATHDFEKFWEMMRREKGSPRPPLTAAQRAAKPPVSHPLVMRHPLSGRRTLYANPGYAMFVDGNHRRGTPPTVDTARAQSIFRGLHRAIQSGLVRSCHDLSEGGLAVALAEMAFAGEFGGQVDLDKIPVDSGHPPTNNFTRLFSESNSRFVCEVEPAQQEAFERAMPAGLFACIGTVEATSHLQITSGKQTVLNEDIFELKRIWQKPLDWS